MNMNEKSKPLLLSTICILLLLAVIVPAFGQPGQPGEKPVIPVTFFWQGTETVDIYQNGSPLRATLLDFRLRSDESTKPAFSAIGTLSDGDVFIAAVRGGSSGHGFTFLAVDNYGRALWKTDGGTWSVFTPPSDGSAWYDPIRRGNTPKRQAAVSYSPSGAQAELNARFGNPAYSIQDPFMGQLVFFYSKVNLGSTAVAEPPRIIAPTTTIKPSSPLRIEAEDFTTATGSIRSTESGDIAGGVCIGWIENDTGTSYSAINLGQGYSNFRARVSSETQGGTIEIRAGGPTGTILGTVLVPSTGSWTTFTTVSTRITSTSGNRDIFLRFIGQSYYLFNVEWFEFF